jgi:hypothetical protein
MNDKEVDIPLIGEGKITVPEGEFKKVVEITRSKENAIQYFLRRHYETPLELSGNKLTPKNVRTLVDYENIVVKFGLGETSVYGKRVEDWLKERFDTKGKTPDYGGNIFVYKEDKLKRKTHDCGDSTCRGLEDTFHVSGGELKAITFEDRAIEGPFKHQFGVTVPEDTTMISVGPDEDIFLTKKELDEIGCAVAIEKYASIYVYERQRKEKGKK